MDDHLRVTVKKGWHNEGRQGTRLGDDVKVDGYLWTPLLWDGAAAPCFFKTAGLKCQPVVLEIDVTGDDGSITIDAHADDDPKTVTFTFKDGPKARRARFPMRMVGNLCSVMLRECRVSTFRFSARTGRHHISVPRDVDVRDVAML